MNSQDRHRGAGQAYASLQAPMAWMSRGGGNVKGESGSRAGWGPVLNSASEREPLSRDVTKRCRP